MKKNFLIILISSLIIFLIYFASNNLLISKSKLNGEVNVLEGNNQSKKYRSGLMNFEIEVLSGYTVEDKFTSLILKHIDGEQISIGKNGTNFENLDDYISNHGNNLSNQIINKRKLYINGLESLQGTMGNERVYFIYTNYIVYSISTSDESLYTDLDQIAQSFQYTP